MAMICASLYVSLSNRCPSHSLLGFQKLFRLLMGKAKNSGRRRQKREVISFVMGTAFAAWFSGSISLTVQICRQAPTQSSSCSRATGGQGRPRSLKMEKKYSSMPALPKLNTNVTAGDALIDSAAEQPKVAPSRTLVDFFLEHVTFYRIHLAAFTIIPLVTSGIFYACNGRFRISYIDSLFICYSSMTVTGLSTINLSTLTPWQQAILYFLMAIVSESSFMGALDAHYSEIRVTLQPFLGLWF